MGITLLSEKPKIDIKSEELRKIIRYDSDGLPIFPAFINGEWYYGNGEYIIINTPIDLSPIAKVPKVQYEVVEKEIDRLYNERFNAKNYPGYLRVEKLLKTVELLERYSEDFEKDLMQKNYPGYLRVEKLLKTVELLERYSEDFENLLIINTGKTRKQALGEIESTLNRIKNIEIDYRKTVGDYLSGEFSQDYLESEGIIKREPLGLLLAITPFNYPLFDSVNKIIFSLLPGNTLIIKPPSLDPLPVILYIKLLELTGFPMKYISLITIPGKDMNKITPNKKISSIIFTGSTETGEEIIKNSGIKQYLMELGGG
ncbi:MAG: aldehyde dehydrogenase family protein, partial [Candidatus Nanopusillus sp.]